MFFETERQNFFRPLNGKRRELVVACLRTLYESLHGPSADYSQSLTRDTLKDLLTPTVQGLINEIAADSMQGEDELSILDSADDQLVTNALIRALLKDGWLETFGDRAGLVTAYRFTRAGKLFAEALWSLDRLRSRSRQRNVRSCRNALEAARKNIDAYDLVDAYDYAEKIISDLSEGVDYFQELVRRLMSEASNTPWDEFVAFLDRFEKEFKKQLTADNVERHRQAIRDSLSRLRNLEGDKVNTFENQLQDIAAWTNQERVESTIFDWLLDRIEDRVEVACTAKHPELIKAMNIYMRRAASIVQQAMMLQGGQRRQAYSRAIATAASLEVDAQTRFLEKLGTAIAPSEIRLLDPAAFKLRSASQRRKALTVTALPKISRDARLQAAMQRTEAAAFTLSNQDVVDFIRGELRLQQRPIRLSSLPTQTATDVLQTMQMVEAVRASRDESLTAKKLPSQLHNAYYTGSDYQLELNHDSDSNPA
ncbi:MAG: ferrochelatase [Methylococcaceae bacterium]|nr:ferrochelatase [Methylococcaceae bacterium]